MNSPHNNRISAAWIVAIVVVAAAGFFLGRSGNSDTPSSSGMGLDAASHDMTSRIGGPDADGEILYWRAPMDPNERYDKPGKSRMGMDLVPVYADAGAAGTVTIDPTIVQNIGVRTSKVQVMPLSHAVRTTGRFEMDEQGAHTVSLKIEGWIEKLYVDYEGSIVKEGDPLFELYSPQLISTEEEYLLSLQNVMSAPTENMKVESERLLEAARRRLINWDLREDQIAMLEERGTPSRTTTFYAPASGEVMNKRVVEGQRVMAGQALMDVMDISRIWLIADIYEQDLPWISDGAAANIELPYRPGRPMEGRIDHIYYMMESETRTARARIILPRYDMSALKPGMFATVYLSGTTLDPTPVVPDEAIIRTGERATVIRALGNGRFMPVEVKTGTQADDLVQILDGLQGGEDIVVRAQFLIDSESRLKSAVDALTNSGDASMPNMNAADPPMDHSMHEMPKKQDGHEGQNMESTPSMNHEGHDMKGMDHDMHQMDTVATKKH